MLFLAMVAVLLVIAVAVNRFIYNRKGDRINKARQFSGDVG